VLRFDCESLQVLCIGAHSDDIEIGAGATLLHLIDNYKTSVDWFVLSADERRRQEAEQSAAAFLKGAVSSTVTVAGFRDGVFPSDVVEIKELFESFKSLERPDLILTHRTDDAHQDHRVVGELTWNTFRSHLVLEYEIPKYDADLARPNVYVPVERDTLKSKTDLLLEHFQSQVHRQWFTEDTFFGLARLRGLECASASSFAEAFYCKKMTLV
jgi:LmbE family N-acetylglucosaminyl deacetylase